MAQQPLPFQNESRNLRQMIADLRDVANLELDKIDPLADALTAIEGIPNTLQLADVTLKVIDDPEAGSSILSAMEKLTPDQVEWALATVDQWRQQNDQTRSAFPDDLFQALQVRLPRLIRDYPALAHYKKANRLSGLTGNIAREIEILCDMRPVFTENRDEIVGLIPLCTLRVGFQSQDGGKRVLTVNLSEATLDLLAERVAFAQRKLQVIREKGANWIPHGVAEGL